MRSISGMIFASRASFQVEDVGGVGEPIHDCICDGRLTDQCMPVAYRELGGDDGPGVLIAVVEDFQKCESVVGKPANEVDAAWAVKRG